MVVIRQVAVQRPAHRHRGVSPSCIRCPNEHGLSHFTCTNRHRVGRPRRVAKAQDARKVSCAGGIADCGLLDLPGRQS
jgi:hypothetical protein